MMHEALVNAFNQYPPAEAPFMHQQLADWIASRPLAGLRVLHHVPVVPNTLLKIACLIAAGADVTVTNPTSFCQAHPKALACLNKAEVAYVDNPATLRGEQFDLYFDCGAQLYQFLGKPNLGAIELTGSGDQFYRQQPLDFPVISIDRSMTKQLETVFGCAESSHMALTQLTQIKPEQTSWIIFGFGKIGRGLAYFCAQNKVPVTIVDVCEQQRMQAQKLGINAINPHNIDDVEYALKEANVVITATGQKAIMTPYPRQWFHHKILANLGIYDEFGPHFSEQDVLNNKMPINFILNDPTPMKYIDPEFYIHNLAALSLLPTKLAHQVHNISAALDQQTIQKWCILHGFSAEVIHSWFINPLG